MGITALPTLHAAQCRHDVQTDRPMLGRRGHTSSHPTRATFLVLTTGRPRRAPAARASFGWSRACPRSSSWPPCSRPSSRPSGGQWRLGDGWRDLGVALTMFWPSGPLVLHLPLARRRPEQPSGPARHEHDLPVSARERVRAHPVNQCGCGRGAAGAGAAERRAVVGKLRCAL